MRLAPVDSILDDDLNPRTRVWRSGNSIAKAWDSVFSNRRITPLPKVRASYATGND